VTAARSTSSDSDSRHFADDLISRVRTLGHPLCVGLDPHLSLLPPLFRRAEMMPGSPQCAEAVGEFLCAVVDRLEGKVAVVKPQIAFFEQLGWRGLECLGKVVERARSRGLALLLDAKRGDIGSTAEGYARAYLEPGAALEVDAITLSPYLGRDSLAPFLQRCAAHGRGMFVLVKTSNPGSGDYQDLELGDGPLYERVAASLQESASQLVGPDTGWSSLGVVVGATYPGQAERVREHLPRALFLVPGYGAQGAGAKDAVRGFVAGPAGREGGVVSSSRGILFPEAGNTTDANKWEQAIDSALEAASSDLGEAVSR
jgi:orotidine-5'-phosphate decarboxylase